MIALRSSWWRRRPFASITSSVTRRLIRDATTKQNFISAAILSARQPKSRLPIQEEVVENPEEAEAKKDSEEQRELAMSSIFGENPEGSDEPLDLVSRINQDFRLSDPYHLHVYSHKRNTHISLTAPDHNTLITKSTGNIGFRKAQRGSYDAAYQLAAYVLNQIYESGSLAKIDKLEVVLRGFGHGREAVTKALVGVEGARLRDRIVRVTDSTRLKFGGTRSRAPRRLG